MADEFTIPDHRELTREERRLLEWLIDCGGSPDAAAFASQLPQTKVVARCTCGCPTLDLAVAEKTSRTLGPSTILANASGQSPEGVPVDVILHARDNEISELEIISLCETKVFGLPTPETLKVG